MDVFITGDRSLPAPLAVVPIAMLMLEQFFAAQEAGEQLRIVTGDNDGVEAAVRLIAGEHDAAIKIVATPRDADGKPDWAARAAELKELGIKVHVLHGAPDASNMLKPMLVSEWDDQLVLHA